jgi:hypothetical protein
VAGEIGIGYETRRGFWPLSGSPLCVCHLSLVRRRFSSIPTYFELLLLVLPVFALIGVGVAARRVHWIEGEAETSLIRLVVNVCYPCLIFESVAANTALQSPGNLLIPPLLGFVVTWFGINAGLLVARMIGLQVGTGLRT